MIYIRCDHCSKELGPGFEAPAQSSKKLSINFDGRTIEYADCCLECVAEAKDWIDKFRNIKNPEPLP